MTLSTHVLDTELGRPAVGLPVRLERFTGGNWRVVARGTTDTDGRLRDLAGEELPAGKYRLVFDTAGYQGEAAFFPEVVVNFRMSDPNEHYHVPLLLSPFSYSTYRGN